MCFSSWSFLTQITNPMGLEGFIWLESLFVGQKKSCFKSAEISAASNMDVGRYFQKKKPAQKSYGHGFPRVDPLPSWSWGEGEGSQKVASNQLKIGQQVAYG